MFTRSLPTLGLAVVLALLGARSATATTLVVPSSSQDAFIKKNAPNRVLGANPTNQRMRVQASPPNTQVWRGLVQFGLGGIPVGSTVTSAIAEINAGNNASNPTLTHGLHRITAPWLQSGVKWNNAPPFVAGATSTALVGTGTGFKSFTVTSDVQAAVNLCAADHGWMIKDENETATNDMVNYVTQEDDHPAQVAKQPKLTVNFTPPSCTTNADCVDTNFCTANEQCVSGVCVVTPVDCDDGDPCTDDICDCGSGCINANICNDGFTCTTDTCNPDTLECTNTPNNAVCNGQCSTGTCVADPDSTTIDPISGCMQTSTSANGTPCNDSDACTTGDQCTSGNCGGAPIVCTPLDQCHLAGTCSAGVCSNPTAPDGLGCNDGDLCTQTDRCNGSGTCVGDDPVTCTPLDDCHDTGTCNPGTGVCSNPPSAGGTGCNDGSLCTQTDQCNGAGTCVGGNPVVCTALDQCHDVGTCSPGTGVCSNPPSAGGTGCNDGSLCTQTDQCNGAGTLRRRQPGHVHGARPVPRRRHLQPGDGRVLEPAERGRHGMQRRQSLHADRSVQWRRQLRRREPGRVHGARPVPRRRHVQSRNGRLLGSAVGERTAVQRRRRVHADRPCDGAGACVGGNPVICTPLDQCHLAGTCDSGTGVCSDPSAPNATPCDDGNTCTISDACLGGTCLGDPTTCGDGVVQGSCNEECDVPGGSPNCTPQCRFVCGPTPQAGCRAPAIAHKAGLTLKDKSPDKKDGLNWKYVKGAPTVVGDFGAPLTTTDYTLCIYDSSARPQPLLLAQIPAGGTCPTKPCWKAIKGGFKYNDKLFTPDGIQQLQLKSGIAGRSKIILKGKGIDIPMPTLPLTTTVTVQLKNEDGVCWEARYSTAIKNIPQQFRAKAD